ncbi:MAG: 2,3-bisphosphoglycerate-independent phosphoglycerate mutase [Pseudomonadota bacterium]
MTPRSPVVLCILDGWGLAPPGPGNAPYLADTPNVDRILATCPNATLITHGTDNGLPDGQMGNSEVGHTHIGAGRVVPMGLRRIDLAIEEGSFASTPDIAGFIADVKAAGGRAHLLGLVSDGGVHAQMAHMIAAARACAAEGVEVLIHAITDGRDVAPGSAYRFVSTLTEALPDVQIATLTGRYFAMDRDNRWSQTKEAYDAIVHAAGRGAVDAHAAITAASNRSESDEFISATVLGDYDGARDGDGVFCLSFRADRALQIMAALGAPDFDAFDIGARPAWASLLGMSDYSDAHNAYLRAAFPKAEIPNTLGDVVAAAGKRQFRVAETEKYPHVTYFLNGGVEAPSVGEDRENPPSPQDNRYDRQPEMSAEAVTDALVGAIEDGYDLIVVNYANPDMVGHTGVLEAAVAACAAVDRGVGRALTALEAAGGVMLLCADHGNCEVMVNEGSGKPHTAHTLNPVPVALIGADGDMADGRLADVAPTLLALMGLDQPAEMTGRVLIS